MSKTQELINIIFNIGITIHTKPWFKDKSRDEVAEWIAKQLKSLGYDTQPCGILVPPKTPPTIITLV